MSSLGIPGLILLILLVGIVVGIIWLLLSVVKKRNASKNMIDLEQRVSELERKNNNNA